MEARATGGRPDPGPGSGSREDRLVGSGFDPFRPAFLSWLGVTQYLTTDAIRATLDVMGGSAAGTQLVMEYLVRDEGGGP